MPMALEGSALVPANSCITNTQMCLYFRDTY